MYDFEIAFYLYKISRLLEIFEENKYKAEAFFKAAMAVDSYSTFITEVYRTGSLKKIEGIGDSSARIIKSVIETGKCPELEELELKYNIEDYSLILSHGISVRIIRKLFNNNIKTILQLRDSINCGAGTLDFGNSEKEKTFQFLKQHERNNGYYLYSYAFCLQGELLESLNKNQEVKIASAKATEWKEKVDCISVVCKTDSFKYVKEQLLSSNRYKNLSCSDTNEEIKCVTAFGIPVVVYFSDSIITPTSVQPVLNGDLHMHTNWSDGKHSIEEMANYSARLGRKYIGISDHTYSLKVARGISEVDALRQIDEIHSLKLKGLKVLSSIEVEVLKDGTLDFSDATLSKFDYVIAGIHTYLQQSQLEMQMRIEKALSNPYVNILAHPTGKLLGRPGVLFSNREPYLSFKSILEICVRNNVVLEINCFPERFDVGVEHFDAIIESGAFVSVGADSHSAAHLNCLEYAEIMLAKYPKLKSKVINTFTYGKLKKFFAGQRKTTLSETDQVQHSTERFDFNYYFGNHSGITSGNDSVIGIDLTGNESKPSGWAVLNGCQATTKSICTDEELIQESLKYNPKVVSIDSPLSYPEGRDCADPNCDCRKYGITRYCERLLSSFGIGVYPCLIPSMEKLTNRGIALAKKFRDLGIEVIESYPGAAQDILSIRRKQKGLAHLKNSYKNFGITGDYLTAQKISHDELDAIMSALVGLFYLNGQYVALGNDKENYLIVPSVAPAPKAQVIIGLTGEIGTGKTTLAEYLCFKHGFKSLSYSQIIRRLYFCDDSRPTLQKIGSNIAKSDVKQRQLSLEIIKEIESHPDTNYVVDGLRHRIDFDTLSEHYGDRFSLLEIQSTFTNKYRRYNKRSFDPVNKEQFQAILGNEAEQDIMSLTMLCYMSNNVITNNKTFKDYFESVELKLEELLCP